MLNEAKAISPAAMPSGKSIERIAAPLAAILILLAPALWNGFPLLQFDTGGYIARWHEGTLEESRSTVYGLFLNAFEHADFWPAVLVQSALTVWILALVLRVHGWGGKPRVLVLTTVVLSLLTTLPWLAGALLTDIFAGLSVLALYLLVLRSGALEGWERGALFLLIAFSAATHSATLIVLLALLAAGLMVALFDRGLIRLSALAPGFVALGAGAALLVAANYAVAGRLAWTPGGSALLFGRMLQAGIVARYLHDHCPDPRFALCAHRDELPTNADDFFWGGSVFDRLGRFQGLNEEMRTIAIECLEDYPWEQVKAALEATADQLVLVATGYGVHNEIWHTYGIIERFIPAALPAMHKARQQKGEIDFTPINRVHLPVAWASMLLVLGVIALAIRSARFADLGALAATAALAILANAVVCGGISNPNDRYGARIAWLAPLVLVLAGWRAAGHLPTQNQMVMSDISKITREKRDLKATVIGKGS
jgi:hypothetical protein